MHMTVNAMDTLQQALNIMAEAPIDVRLTEYEMSFFEDSLAEFPSAAYVWPLSRMSAYTRLNVATLLANARRCFTKVYPSGVIGRGSALYQHFKFNELFEDNFSRANLVSTYIRALAMVAFQRGVWYSIQPVLSAIMQERLMSCYTRSQKLKSIATSNYAHHHHTNADSSRAIARLATLASAYSSVLTLITGPDLLLWLNVAPP